VTRSSDYQVPRHPALTKGLVTKLANAAERSWRCGVVDSGYHNGVRCSPTSHDHHDPYWECGWYWVAKIPARPPRGYNLEAPRDVEM
jgi:hypothetical protein